MATRINLLPWREELRKQQERNFYTALAFAAILGGGIWFAGYTYFDDQLQFQERRNSFLESEIATLDKKIIRIKELEKTRENLEARMNVIETLQRGRPQVVHLMEEFVDTLPDGVYLVSLTEQGENITLRGVAESNARVSDFMENLEASGWLTDPDLSVIEVTEIEGGPRISNFTLSVRESTPATEGAKGTDGEA